MFTLEELGWGPFFEKAFQDLRRPDLLPARVAEESKDLYRVATRAGAVLAEAAGKLRFAAQDRAGLPAVGDWVAVSARTGEGRATIHHILPRRTKFSRKAAGRETAEQVVAANVDTVFAVTSLNRDLNLRRIERYLALVWESGARPVVLLTKADLCADVRGAVLKVEAVAAGVPVHALSAVSGEGLEDVLRYLGPGQTGALLGSSGVGKSTLINRLLGEDRLATREVRAGDDRGRHATASRQLVPLPQGGLLMDTPGMRELGLWGAEEGLARAFQDIATLAAACRFRDCSHRREPGCAVRAALADGSLDAARWESYDKLGRELAFLERKRDPAARSAHEKRWRKVHAELKRRNKQR